MVSLLVSAWDLCAKNNQAPIDRPIVNTAATPSVVHRNGIDFGAGFAPVNTAAKGARLDSESRFHRCKFVRMVDAFWYRSFGSFSSAFVMISSSLGGTSGFNRMGGTGARSKMAFAMTPLVSPRNGIVPVAIS